MTARQVLTDIYISDEVKQVVKRLKPAHLQDDILQHCFLELFTKPEDFILDLHSRGKLKAYIVKTMIITSRLINTPFAKMIGKETPVESFKDFHECQEDDIIPDIERIMKDMYWYKSEIMKMYADKGTLRAVSEDTGINIKSLHGTIREARKEIKKKLWQS